MTGFNQLRMFGVVTAGILCSSVALAQTPAVQGPVGVEQIRVVSPAGGTVFPQTAAWTQSVRTNGLSRRQKILISTGAGAVGGLLVGEYYFGRKLDVAHGPDMLLGAGIGAGIGALLSWTVTKRHPSIANLPFRVGAVIAPTRKSLTVTLPIK